VVEEKLLAISHDLELTPKFRKSYQDFWLQKKVSVAIQYCGTQWKIISLPSQRHT